MKKSYTFYTKTDKEGVREHKLVADSCKKAYELLKGKGYLSEEITLTGYLNK